MLEGKVIAFTGDTGWVEMLCEVAQGADLFISECFQYDVTLPIHLDYTTIDANYERLGAKRVLLTHMGEAMLSAGRKSRRVPLSHRPGWHDARSMSGELRGRARPLARRHPRLPHLCRRRRKASHCRTSRARCLRASRTARLASAARRRAPACMPPACPSPTAPATDCAIGWA